MSMLPGKEGQSTSYLNTHASRPATSTGIGDGDVSTFSEPFSSLESEAALDMDMDSMNVVNPCFSGARRGPATDCFGNPRKSACTVCQKECNLSSSCGALESMYMKNFYTGLEIYLGMGSLTEPMMNLPFCNSCRDKVVYFAHAVQSFQHAKTIFESIRTDLAFTTVESSRQLLNSSLNFELQTIVRDSIISRWTDEYETKKAEMFSSDDRRLAF